MSVSRSRNAEFFAGPRRAPIMYQFDFTNRYPLRNYDYLRVQKYQCLDMITVILDFNLVKGNAIIFHIFYTRVLFFVIVIVYGYRF